jgi:hypothetical protein
MVHAMKPRARTEKKADDAAGFEQGTIGRVTLSMGDGSSGGARDKSWEGSVQSRAEASDCREIAATDPQEVSTNGTGSSMLMPPGLPANKWETSAARDQ